MANKTVLVTGANSFVAAQILHRLFKDGYNVVGTVRSTTAAEKVRKSHGQ